MLVMNTAKIYPISSKSAEQTISIGTEIGRRLRGREIIELVSDIGGGKTTFVKGLALGINSVDVVSSPTFTLSRIYRSANRSLSIHHYDFYRLDQPGIVASELLESINDPQAVVVIEWSDIVRDVLPESRLTIDFQIGQTETGRLLTCNVPAGYGYLWEGWKI
jgi:tRNA threonylcarbamoyladenosine biosynthesis protein TsaE